MLDKAKEHSISGPELPRKRCVPKRFEEGSSQWSHPESPEDYYRQIYFKVIDNVTELIKSYFNQPEFKVYGHMEKLLLSSIGGVSSEEDLQCISDTFRDDINSEHLLPQLSAFRVILEEKATNILTFGDILKSVKEFLSSKLHLIPDVMQIIRLILVSSATSATGERRFSLARRLKT